MTSEQTVRIDPDDPRGPEAGAARRRIPSRRLILIGLVVGVALIAFVGWWFQPQALFIDDVVDEDFPIGATAQDADGTTDPDQDASSDDEAADPEEDGGSDLAADADADAATDDQAADDAADEPAAAAGPVALRSGDFTSRNRYEVTGTATAFALDDTERILRLEDFESTNGPDLFVYLVAADASADDAAFDEDFVDLGVLTGNIGNQNYVIPADVDLDVYDTVVIWCRRFTSSFGVAALDSVAG
jgi:hypothetical protein